MKKIIVVLALVATLCKVAYSSTVIPTSNVLGDTDANAGTLVLRDSVGASTFAQLDLTANTTNSLVTLVPTSTGAILTVQLFTAGVLGSAYGTCVSSGIGAGAWVWPSTSSTAGARACN